MSVAQFGTRWRCVSLLCMCHQVSLQAWQHEHVRCAQPGNTRLSTWVRVPDSGKKLLQLEYKSIFAVYMSNLLLSITSVTKSSTIALFPFCIPSSLFLLLYNLIIYCSICFQTAYISTFIVSHILCSLVLFEAEGKDGVAKMMTTQKQLWQGAV